MSSVDSTPTKLGNEKITQPITSTTNASSSSIPSTAPKTRLGLVPGENIKEKQVNIFHCLFIFVSFYSNE